MKDDLGKKILAVINDHYKDEAEKQDYEGLLLYAFCKQDEEGSEGIRAIYHSVNMMRMIAVAENIREELDEKMGHAVRHFMGQSMH